MTSPLLRTPRRGSVAVNFLLLMVVASLGFGAFLIWQRNERVRVQAEIADKAAEATEGSGEVDVSKIPVISGGEPKPISRPPVLIVEPYIEINTPAPVDNRPVGPDWKTVEFEEVPEGADVLRTLKSQGYKYTPTMLQSYLRYVKAKARADLAASERELPEEFMRWVESDPVRMLAVYCSRNEPARVLVMLRSLELDLGVNEARSPKYQQLVLATAITCANEAESVDLNFKDRKPKTLVIPKDPRVWVNTKDKKRTLDMNDHIINFFEDHEPLTTPLAGGLNHAMTEILYDNRDKPKEPYVVGKAKHLKGKPKRLLIAADVLASRKLQEEFNAYMKSKGFDVNIDCGDNQISAAMASGVKGPYGAGIMKAAGLFRTAYEQKGRLAVRDHGATAYERCAYIIRNEKVPVLSPSRTRMPHFPVDAPWPMLLCLTQNSMPLREREDILLRFKLRGEWAGYGEYTGGIAQQPNFQWARRLSPYAFGDNSYQQIIKDGGVCGRMASMQTALFITAGVPASNAGQPGHCAGVYAGYNKKANKYGYGGYQYVTGGDEATHPHARFDMMELGGGPMAFWQGSAYAVNLGMRSFVESMAAYQIYRLIPNDVKEEREGRDFLRSAVTINPYNFALAQLAFSLGDADETLKLWGTYEAAVKSTASKSGNVVPKETGGAYSGGLFMSTIRSGMVDRLSRLPAPKDAALAALLAKMKKMRADELAHLDRLAKSVG